jgi:glutamyl-tRNA synthetase
MGALLENSYAEKLIKKGLAYCDASTAEEMNAQRMAFQPSPYREKSVEENLAAWKEMQTGSEAGRKFVLRAKIDYASKNGTMRDPALYRVVLDPPHLRTGFVIYLPSTIVSN